MIGPTFNILFQLKNVLSKVGYPDYLYNEQDLTLKYEKVGSH